MPRLTMMRDGDRDIQYRYAIMYLDDELLCHLKYRHSHDVEIEPGHHVLVGKNELGRKAVLEFEASDDETVHVNVEAVPGGCFAASMWLIPAAPIIELTLIEDEV